ncbi:MAG: hypothetical protein JW993_12235 [Sedimentisphaerales bacterium]|nr:hypothetical protein [Sedimentisphaerales bacterium]
MSVLTVNLKHLYQHRGLWLQYGLLAWFGYVAFVVHRTNEHLVWVWYVLINFVAGLACGMLQREILSKPFTYCLPGQRPVSRRVIGVAGVTLNLVLSALIVTRGQSATVDAILVMAASFSLGLAIYMVVARSMFTLSDRILPFLAVQTLFMGLLFAQGRSVGELIYARPELVTALTLSVCAVVWMDLRRDVWARRFCGQRLQNLGDFSRASIERNQSVRQARATDSIVPSQVEAAFLARIEASRPLSVARCIWADLYATFGMMFSWWRWILLIVLPGGLGLAYGTGKMARLVSSGLPGRALGVFSTLLFLMPICLSLVSTFQIPLGVFSNMLLSRGRRERLVATISIALALAVLLSGLLGLILVCGRLLHVLAPETFGSFRHVFGPGVTLAFIAMPFAMVPLGLAVRLIDKYLCVTLIYAFLFCLFVLIALAGRGFDMLGLPLLVAVTIGSWLAFLLAAHRICTRHSFSQTDRSYGLA